MREAKKILVAPLNWGLGHATRMIPMIRGLTQQGATVILAADGRPLELLRKEFPMLKSIRLSGYEIKYHEKRNLTWQILFQLPKIIQSYFHERNELRRIIQEERIDAVISDNRFGLRNRGIFSIFVTHQIAIKMPRGLKWLEKTIYRLNKLLIEKFDICWIPDFEGNINLSGELTRKYPLPDNATFIDPLSRMKLRTFEKKYDLLMLISGPEPQRAVLEKLLSEQARDFSGKILMVCGIPETNSKPLINQCFTKVNFMTSAELNDAIVASDLIISRCGYSTVMDLAALGKKAIFIPTPGQTEQEYLADYLMKNGIAYSESQSTFNLAHALKKAESFSGFSFQINSASLNLLIHKFLLLLSSDEYKIKDDPVSRQVSRV